MPANVTTQGHCLTDDERGQLPCGNTAALVLGGLLLAARATVTATNLCLPSEMFAWLKCRRASTTTKPISTEGVACDGCPPIERLFEQYAEGGGELLVRPICLTSRGLDGTEFVANARVAGATPLWEWIGDEPATVFSY